MHPLELEDRTQEDERARTTVRLTRGVKSRGARRRSIVRSSAVATPSTNPTSGAIQIKSPTLPTSNTVRPDRTVAIAASMSAAPTPKAAPNPIR